MEAVASEEIRAKVTRRRRRKSPGLYIRQEPPFGPITNPPVLFGTDGDLFIGCCGVIAEGTFNKHVCPECKRSYWLTVSVTTAPRVAGEEG